MNVHSDSLGFATRTLIRVVVARRVSRGRLWWDSSVPRAPAKSWLQVPRSRPLIHRLQQACRTLRVPMSAHFRHRRNLPRYRPDALGTIFAYRRKIDRVGGLVHVLLNSSRSIDLFTKARGVYIRRARALREGTYAHGLSVKLGSRGVLRPLDEHSSMCGPYEPQSQCSMFNSSCEDSNIRTIFCKVSFPPQCVAPRCPSSARIALRQCPLLPTDNCQR
ncbi:hypothetical protein VTO73DRAFT_101 [Trametes versicolor]